MVYENSLFTINILIYVLNKHILVLCTHHTDM